MPRLLGRRRHHDVVSGTNLLPLPATDLHYIGMHRPYQAGSSTTMPNIIRGMYLLIIALHGLWRKSNWHYLRSMKHILQIVCASHRAGLYIYIFCAHRIVHEVHILEVYTYSNWIYMSWIWFFLKKENTVMPHLHSYSCSHALMRRYPSEKHPKKSGQPISGAVTLFPSSSAALMLTTWPSR
jgi:hypothetical protein